MPLILSGNTGTSTLDSSNGLTFSDSSLQGAAASPFVLKNRIINGAMQVWQRGTSFTNIIGGNYSADRFVTQTVGINLTITQDTLVPNVSFKYSLKAVPASNATPTECVIRQFIEQQNITDFAGQTVTGSAWVYSSKSSLKFRLGAQNATGGTDVPQIISVTAATWTRITFSFSSYAAVTAWTSTPNASGGFLDIGFPDSTALTTSDYLYITGVQLEIGTTATPFERRMYGQELANCQRYYQLISNFIGYGVSATQTNGMVTANVSMRATPSFSLTGVYSISDYYALDHTQSSASIVLFSATPAGAAVGLPNMSGLSFGRVYLTRFLNSNQITMSAEL